MKKDTHNSNTTEQTIQSNCSIIETLIRPPYSLISGNGVCYSYYDFDGQVFVEHKIKSDVPLTQTDIDVLEYLLERVDSDGKIQMTGKELFDRFGRSGKVFDSVLAIKNLDILNKITHAETQRSVYHRFGVIKSFTENQNCSNWQELRDDTDITITLYERFADVYLDHTISDLNLTIDEKKDDKKDADDELAEIMSARTGKPEEEEQPAEEENEEGEEREEDEDGDNKEAAPKDSVKQVDDNTLVLISVRQLNRIFGDEHDDEFEIADGFLLKYHGQGGDIVIPKSVVVICDHAFEGCAGLTSVTIPNSVKLIGKDAFRNCSNLVEVDMPFYLLKSVAPCVGFFFSGSQIAELLRKDSEFWKRYAAEMKDQRIEEAEKEEEENENDKDESEEGNMDGDENENGKDKDDNGGGASTEKP